MIVDELEEQDVQLTRSQIKNRKKKEKKLAEKEANMGQKMNGDSEKEGISKGEKSAPAKATEEERPSKVNGLTTSKKKQQPSTEQGDDDANPRNPLLHKVNGIAPSPASQRLPSLTNGIKHSPSPSIHSTPRSPPHSVPIISSPVPEPPNPTSIDDLRARLAARISQARIARKAVGTSIKGAPQTREEILLARAKRKAKVEEKIKTKKAVAAAAAKEAGINIKKEDSPESTSDDEIIDTGLTFNKVTLNGTEIDVGKAQVKTVPQKKGASDAKGRLNHLLARESRLSQMSPEKAEKAIEHDRWHHALLAARGEKDKNDIGLLKKTIARKEREKRKSKRDWDARIAAVERGKAERQRKREENIAKRKEEKGGKPGGRKKAGKGKNVVKKKRPGFEGGRVKFGRK